MNREQWPKSYIIGISIQQLVSNLKKSRPLRAAYRRIKTGEWVQGPLLLLGVATGTAGRKELVKTRGRGRVYLCTFSVDHLP